VRDDEPPHGLEDEEWEEEAPRSLFASTWFRVVVVVLAFGAVAAVSVPYVMDSLNPAPPGPTVTRAPAADKAKPSSPPGIATPAPVLSPAPAPPAPATAPAAPGPPSSSPSVASVIEKAPPPTPAKTQAPRQVAQAPKAESAKTAPQKADSPKSAESPKSAAKREPAKSEPEKSASKDAATAGELWVQVGAYRDTTIVKRVSTTLTDKGFSVSESTLTRGGRAPESGVPAGVDRYDVVVSGGVPADVTRKLTEKGLSAEPVSEGAVVRPSLALRDAVTLSNDLRGEGLSVSVRRVGKGAPAPAGSGAGTETLHRVRVGPFPDRAAANAAVQKLRDLGYTPFIARAGD